MKVLIKGAGIAGRCVALLLKEQGIAFELVEHRPLGDLKSASAIAAGMLCPYAEQDHAGPELIDEGLTSINIWKRWQSKYQIGLVESGTLVLSFSAGDNDFERICRNTGSKPLSGETLSALEPSMSPKVVRALHFPTEARVHPETFFRRTTELVGNALRHNFQSPLDYDSRFDWIIDCTGITAQAKLNSLRGVRGEIIRVHAPNLNIHHTLRLMHPRHPLYIVPQEPGIYAIGASLIETEDTSPVSVETTLGLLSGAYFYNPLFAEARILSMDTSLRPAFQNNLPQLVRHGRTLFLNGMYRHGYLLGPCYAERALLQMLGPK